MTPLLPLARMSALLLLTGCGHRDSTALYTSTPPRISSVDRTTYERGRRREIELTRAALELLQQAREGAQRTVMATAADPNRMTDDAARSAGVGLDEYRRLVLRVDSSLVADSTMSANPSDRLLDSLRVVLVVLRSRLTAEISQPKKTDSRINP